ncbi:unnamed protein product [Danaus chrysippus]|uniref:(African queen) hypothetical protein n=1 Tax=Danaus chrysippus TaxID=151541 RepID=A0A8J2R0C3_9NEOP|nr:unnamed protein product [Danaus chrysippus]
MLTPIFLLLALHFAASDIPPYIKVCQRKDPNVDKCIINSVEELRPKMKEVSFEMLFIIYVMYNVVNI